MSSIRVISGKAKGRKLKSVPGTITRPITDRVKEALYNIIGADIFDATMLDLFGGTGSVGIEALSRGANFVRFIDKHKSAVKTIRENLKLTGLSTHAEVFQNDALKILRKPADRAFDYLYVAPPQYKNIWEKTMQLLDENIAWLSNDSWVIVQIHPVEYYRLSLAHLAEFDQRDYGSTKLVFYALTNPEES